MCLARHHDHHPLHSATRIIPLDLIPLHDSWPAFPQNRESILTFATAEEFENDTNAAAFNGPLSLLPIYLALHATSHVAPAQTSREQILATVGQTAPRAETNERVVEAAKEVARAAGGELHNISALTGGMVAQEVIKVITKQYVPIDNTCVFDGIRSRCQVLRL